MDAADIALRNATYRRFVELGRAPTTAEMAAALGRPAEDVEAGWRRLHDAHALVLAPNAAEILMANPFAARPTPFRVDVAGRSWFGNCAWDALGVGAALHADCTVDTTCADCGEALRVNVRDGLPDQDGLVFHVLVPAAGWWDDIGFT
jgi:hypothetical protein